MNPNTIHRATVVEIVPATWGSGGKRMAVLDAPSPDHPGPLGVSIPKGARGWKVGVEIAYTMQPAVMRDVDAYGTVLATRPIRGKTDIFVLTRDGVPVS